MLKLTNTLTGKLEVFEPQDGTTVRMYACGPTVYSRIHIGNARPYVIFGLLKRFLEHEGLAVRLVVNITDVNDKIYDAARAQGRPSAELAAQMADLYRLDTDGLGLPRPDEEPLASETIGPILDYIAALIESGHAYPAGGDVTPEDLVARGAVRPGELVKILGQGETDSALRVSAHAFSASARAISYSLPECAASILRITSSSTVTRRASARRS